LIASCGDDIKPEGDLTDITYAPSSYNKVFPSDLPAMVIPDDNPLTEEGVLLGRHLFYDPILSADSTQSCSSCHLQEGSFTDNLSVSEGIDGIKGSRSSMSLINVGYNNNGLFWDGRAKTLEDQALLPVEDPIEMHNTWSNVEISLSNHPTYPALFRKAFGISNKEEINKFLVSKAIAQFERIITSTGETKFDRVMRGEAAFTDQELMGFDMFFDLNSDLPDAECAHCHNAPLFTIDEYINNGLDAVESLEEFKDPGRGIVTGLMSDNGKFRTPTLRNVIYSAPYMHDGRFQSLEEVIEHYNSGGFIADNVDPLIRPLGLTEDQKEALLKFIMTFQEENLLFSSEFVSPF